MARYFKIHFYSGEELFASASSMDRVALWILQNRPMADFYLVNIIEVNSDKSRKAGGDFLAEACREYYHSEECYGNLSDEAIRQKEIKRFKDYIRRHR